jgi:CheY-like chemotaxis protein
MQTIQKSQPPCSSLLVLLVDDCPFQRVLTADLLARWGIEPTTAADGEEAIQLDGYQDFDLILMDIQMPGINGFETTRRIREAQSRRQSAPLVPVVAYTASPLPLDPELMKRSGIDDVVQKPCDASTMSDCLARWCAGKFSPLKPRPKSVAHA